MPGAGRAGDRADRPPAGAGPLLAAIRHISEVRGDSHADRTPFDYVILFFQIFLILLMVKIVQDQINLNYQIVMNKDYLLEKIQKFQMMLNYI